jgi:hypothetical protein
LTGEEDCATDVLPLSLDWKRKVDCLIRLSIGIQRFQCNSFYVHYRRDNVSVEIHILQGEREVAEGTVPGSSIAGIPPSPRGVPG